MVVGDRAGAELAWELAATRLGRFVGLVVIDRGHPRVADPDGVVTTPLPTGGDQHHRVWSARRPRGRWPGQPALRLRRLPTWTSWGGAARRSRRHNWPPRSFCAPAPGSALVDYGLAGRMCCERSGCCDVVVGRPRTTGRRPATSTPSSWRSPTCRAGWSASGFRRRLFIDEVADARRRVLQLSARRRRRHEHRVRLRDVELGHRLRRHGDDAGPDHVSPCSLVARDGAGGRRSGLGRRQRGRRLAAGHPAPPAGPARANGD